MNIILDSSFVISLIKLSDSNHKEAVSLLTNLPENANLIIPSVVVAESIIFSRNVLKDLELIKKISNKFQEPLEDDYLSFQKISLDSRKSLKANDCLILAISIRKKARVLTFDKKLLRAYQKLINK